MNDPGQVGPSHCGSSRADSTETYGMFDGWWKAWASLSFVLSFTMTRRTCDDTDIHQVPRGYLF